MHDIDALLQKQIRKNAQKILMNERASFDAHTPYLYEEHMLDAIQKGDAESALHWLFLLDHSGKSGTLSSNPLRQAQYIFVSHITQITRAAIHGGIHEDIAFALSDSYIQSADCCKTPEQIQTLRKSSVMDFCSLTAKQKSSPPHSRHIRKVIQYIHNHLSDKLDLDLLTEISGLSMSRFCHLFKQETGMSPMHYVLLERIETAKSMLLHTDRTISDIGLSLGFYNESHFIRQFKIQTRITPSRYRKMLPHDSV